MKTIVIFLGLVVVCLQCIEATDDLDKAYEQAYRKCIESQKPSPETITMVFRENVYDNRDVNCMRACILNNMNFMHDAKFNYEAAEKFSAAEKPADQAEVNRIIAALKDCKEQSEISDDECAVVGNYVKCIHPFIEAAKQTDNRRRSTTANP